MVLGALVLVIAAWSSAAAAAATQVQGLYEARVAVADRSDGARRAALLAALGEVVVKVSGRGQGEWAAELGAQAGDPVGYLGQYRYEEAGVGADPGTSPPGAMALTLWAAFDQVAVNELVRRLGLPVWGRLRPNVLVWAGLEQDGQRRVLGATESEGDLEEVRAGARARGVPVVFPLLDLEDQTRLRVSDLWGGFSDRILAASERYRCDAVLAGRVYPVGAGLWEGSWVLYLDGTESRWTVRGESVAAALGAATDGAADRLAQRYAVAGAGAVAGGWELVVVGVTGLGDFARVTEYLGRLDGIEGLRLVALEGEQAIFRVQSTAGPEVVRRQLTLGGVLAVSGAGDGWVYELRR